MAFTFSQPDAILSTTLMNYRKTLSDNIFNAIPFYWWIHDKGGKETRSGGESIVEPLLYGANDTVAAYSGYEVLDKNFVEIKFHYLLENPQKKGDLIMEQTSLQGDYQQRRIEDRLNWLGGIIDGEGTVTVIKRVDKRWKQNCWQPRISIANTNLQIIEEIIDILKINRIPYYLQSKKNPNPIWKKRYDVVICGIRRCNNAIPKLLRFLVAKKEKMQYLLEWCAYRLSVPYNSTYNQNDLRLLNLIRENSIPFNDQTWNSKGKVFTNRNLANGMVYTPRKLGEDGRNDHLASKKEVNKQ